MRRRNGVVSKIIVAALSFFATGCVSGPTQRPAAMPTTMPPTLEQRTAESLDVVLDERGRPYDVTDRWDWQENGVEVEFIDEFFAPQGQVRVLDGNAIQVNPYFFAEEASPADFGAHENLDLSVIWEVGEYEGRAWRGVLGVRLDVGGARVERWQPFESGYGTDGGTGGLTTERVLGIDVSGSDFLFDWDYETDFYLGDHDGVPGNDTFVWGNGAGDGGFPMTQGLDYRGRLVSLIVWDTRYPWRLAVGDGLPPQDVTAREDELLECMNGTRLVDHWGECLGDT